MKLRIAVQSKGRLRDASLEFLQCLGIDCRDANRGLVFACPNADLEILFVRNSDIPTYVEQEVADFGIVGRNVLFESGCDLPVLKELGFGTCSLIIAAPEGNENLEGERIATSYPNSLRSYLKEKGINASIVEINGSVEIAPALDLADAVCDITQTGNTLRENNLEIVDTVFTSQACLICNSKIYSKNYEEVLLQSIR